MTRDRALERLASRVLWPGFVGTAAPDWMLRALEDGVPGAVYFGSNVDADDPTGLGRLSACLSDVGGPLLLGIDEEGGDVTRLEAEGGSTLPGAAQLGILDDTDVTRAVAAHLGARVRAAGATVVLAPVADVNTDPRNPIIGVRSFGAEPGLVARHVAASVRGLSDAGVLSCAKHFPGHGETTTDSHTGLPRVEVSLERLTDVHLAPFAAAVDAGVDAIMTAHIVFPRFGVTPATLNPRVLALARDLGFDGLIVTDALDMAAVRETVGMRAGAVAALAAGADLLCLGNPATSRDEGSDRAQFASVRAGLVEAMRDGTLDPGRVEDAAGRVDAARRAVDAARPGQPPALDIDAVLDAAIRIHGRLPAGAVPSLVLDARHRASGVVVQRAEPFSTALGARVVSIGEGHDVRARARAVARASGDAVVLLVLVDGLPSAPWQRDVVDAVRGERPDPVVVDVGVPGSVAAPAVATSGANRATAERLARILMRGTSR